MISDTSKEHFTEQDMIDFWTDNQVKAASEDYLRLNNKMGEKPETFKDGMYFYGKNSIIILKNGRRHSLTGPAFITMYQHLKKPAGIDYYVDGNRLKEGSFKRDLLTAKRKRDQKTLKEKSWL